MDSRWSDVNRVFLPGWLSAVQNGLQCARYPDDGSKMDLVFRCARENAARGEGAPLAAAVFLADGFLVAIGVDGPGIGGHEMTSALILASNLIGSRRLRTLGGWELFSVAPPCLVCQGNIHSEKPARFVHAVTHVDLLATLDLPNLAMPQPEWARQLAARGIEVEGPSDRRRGLEVLRTKVDGSAGNRMRMADSADGATRMDQRANAAC